MQKINFQDLPNTTTPVDADNLNLLQDNIENDIGDLTELETTIKTDLVSAINEANQHSSAVYNEYSTSTTGSYSANYVNNAIKDVYSTTEETLTNKFWIDGKPIYRKVISTGAISSTNTDVFYSMNFNVSDIGQITKIDGMFNINIGSLPVNFHNENNTSYDTLAYYNTQQTVARIGVRNNYAITSGYIVVEYTKAS